MVLRRGGDGISALKMRDSVLQLRCQVEYHSGAGFHLEPRHSSGKHYTQYGTEQSLPSHQTELAQKEQAIMVRGIHALATAGAFRLN